MRKTPAIVLVAFIAVVALAPVTGQAPPQPPKSKGTPPGGSKSSPTVPAAGANIPPVPAAATFPTEIGGKTVDGWIKEIDSPDPSVRDHAIKSLIFFGPNARKAIPVLVRQSKTLVDLSPQASAILALGEIVRHFNADKDRSVAKDVKDTVDALVYSLDNSSQGIIRYRAAVALAQLGPQARAAVPKLAQRVGDPSSWEIRFAVCKALARVGVDEQNLPNIQALNALVKAITDSCKEVRIEALEAIVNLGPPPSGDLTTFKNLLEQRLKTDKDKSVQIWVRLALMRMNPTAASEANVAAVAQIMKDGGDVEVRAQAAKALGYISAMGHTGSVAKLASSDLIDTLKSDDPMLTMSAAWALSCMGASGERAIPALEILMNTSKNEDVKSSAKAAIEEIKKRK